MATSVIVNFFVSVNGWAGSDGLPGYFGYLGPELQEWIMGERPLHSSWSWGGAPTKLWRRFPRKRTASPVGPDSRAGKGPGSPHVDPRGLAQHADLQRGSRR